ncbi:hypothetical protein Hhel01_03735 [Haloferula helveola]
MVPYASATGRDRFPHSMEFSYFALDELMKGPDEFDWTPIDAVLRDVKKRRNQLIFRVYAEYPGKASAVPEYLIDAGLAVTDWTSEGGRITHHTPDYEDGRFRDALEAFIKAMGAKYDGNPDIGYITAGLLGSWGEWHTYPRPELWASKRTQREVMDAYAGAFKATKVLLRYPAGPESERYSDNHDRPFGYHDDSFAWTTLKTGGPNDSWCFEGLLEATNAGGKWKHQPIGGEIRPELWSRSFTSDRHPRDQGFVECVEAMHVTWLMDSGLFDARFPMDEERKRTALTETARLGYELHVAEAKWADGVMSLTVENRGVAPFYYDWPVEVEVEGEVRTTNWRLTDVLPGQPRVWSLEMAKSGRLRIRIPNPMKGGRPLRFANKQQGMEWLVVQS